MEILGLLTSKEKDDLYQSLPLLNKNVDFFVDKFYSYLMQTDAKHLFEHTDFAVQQKMFRKSLNILVTHFSDSPVLKNYLDLLINRHASYGVVPEYVDFFIDSFKKALTEIYTEPNDIRLLAIWSKVVYELMNYFKESLKGVL